MSRIEQIAEELGEVEGKMFMVAMRDKKISGGMIHMALADIGIVIARSTINCWRRLHNVV